MHKNIEVLNTLRPLGLERNYLPGPKQTVLISQGNTKVLCSATLVLKSVPRFMRDSGKGWLTAEYAMLPAATATRCDREAVRGKQTGRTIEISRLVGRSLRQCVDLRLFAGHTIIVDCDVLSADGGTRCASINGGVAVLAQAMQAWVAQGLLKENPFKQYIYALGAGIVDGQPCLDLDYAQDSSADFDLNVVLNAGGDLVEIQGTGEKAAIKPATIFTLVEEVAAVREAMLAKLHAPDL